jgi:hypothetical protein
LGGGDFLGNLLVEAGANEFMFAIENLVAKISILTYRRLDAHSPAPFAAMAA